VIFAGGTVDVVGLISSSPRLVGSTFGGTGSLPEVGSPAIPSEGITLNNLLVQVASMILLSCPYPGIKRKKLATKVSTGSAKAKELF
jgi:hypothetical protein